MPLRQHLILLDTVNVMDSVHPWVSVNVCKKDEEFKVSVLQMELSWQKMQPTPAFTIITHNTPIYLKKKTPKNKINIGNKK